MEENHTQGEGRSQLPVQFFVLILVKFQVRHVESTKNLITSRDVPGGHTCHTCGAARQERGDDGINIRWRELLLVVWFVRHKSNRELSCNTNTAPQ
jgi:hypothetical protein